jgi:hypothetical protein
MTKTNTKSKAKVDKVPVSERALIQRINRVLAKRNEVMKTTRNRSRAEFDLGRYYVVRYGGAASSNIIAHHQNLESYGHELDVLQPWEQLVP